MAGCLRNRPDPPLEGVRTIKPSAQRRREMKSETPASNSKGMTRNELIIWLGSLFWMGRHYEYNREYYWDKGISTFGQKVMSKTRWEQIHRFLKINLKSKRQEGQPWWYKVDPLLTTVRQNIQEAVHPASWLAVDELMIPFQGRTKHSIKIKGKPIKEGFKMWCLGFKGYIWSFNFHSSHENDEGMTPSRTAAQINPLPSVKLAPTFQVPLVLCEKVRQVYSEQLFLVFLDNLFLNVSVAHCFACHWLCCYGYYTQECCWASQITHFSQR